MSWARAVVVDMDKFEVCFGVEFTGLVGGLKLRVGKERATNANTLILELWQLDWWWDCLLVRRKLEELQI